MGNILLSYGLACDYFFYYNTEFRSGRLACIGSKNGHDNTVACENLRVQIIFYFPPITKSKLLSSQRYTYTNTSTEYDSSE